MSYKVVIRPYQHETTITQEDFQTVQEALEYAISMMATDFLIVTVVDWEANVVTA